VANCYAAEAGLKIILDVGTREIERRIRQLTRRCMERLEEIGWPSITPRPDERRGPMICVHSKDSARLSAKLMERDIVTSYRDQGVRATIHFYNTDDDIDTFVAALAQLRAELRGSAAALLQKVFETANPTVRGRVVMRASGS
jgi:selenocysteine lyase/cysteine desulfurase